MIPKNIALAGPDRAALRARPADLGDRHGAASRSSRAQRGGQRRRSGCAGRAAQDEVSSTYTREEVAALVEESRGEGLLEEGEYDRLAGALGFTEKTVDDRAAAPRPLETVPRGSHRRRRRGAVRGDRLLAGSRSSGDDGRAASATCTSRTCSRPTRTDAPRVVEDKWIRPFADGARRRPLHDALQTLQAKGAHMARVVDDDGDGRSAWPPSRTSSRSWSARSATRPTPRGTEHPPGGGWCWAGTRPGDQRRGGRALPAGLVCRGAPRGRPRRGKGT